MICKTLYHAVGKLIEQFDENVAIPLVDDTLVIVGIFYDFWESQVGGNLIDRD